MSSTVDTDDEWMARARRVVVASTDDRYAISEGLVRAFGRALRDAWVEGVASGEVEEDSPSPRELRTAQRLGAIAGPLSQKEHRVLAEMLHLTRCVRDSERQRANKAEKCLMVADKLAAEAQSYVSIGHATGDEDQPLEEAIAAYKALRLL